MDSVGAGTRTETWGGIQRAAGVRAQPARRARPPRRDTSVRQPVRELVPQQAGRRKPAVGV